jgi:aldehyde:ferredoxin oxidoreductase
MGQLLHVDLTRSALWDEPLDAALARAYVGGSGLAARLIYERVDGDTDPLGPDNPLLLMTGPLVGTAMPSAGRCSVCALSPLTGIWGEANTGGYIGPELRFSGYDGIVITGQAREPVWLSIVDGCAELHPAIRTSGADALWGLDAYETQRRIRDRLADDQVRIACIGPAGERLAKMAAVINDHGRAAGRTGMGAVFGAKQLKAIALRGTARVPLADEAALHSVRRAILGDLGSDLSVTTLQLAGTAAYVDTARMFGDMPTRYYQQGEWEPGDDLSGILMSEQYQVSRSTCYRCPIACGRVTHAPAYGAERVDGPEFETIGAFGSLLLNNDLQAVIYAGHLCNLYGLDTISTGCTIALACEMFERGLLTTADTGGITLSYGDPGLVHRLIAMIARREGLGDLLAEGSAALAERFDAPELAVTVNRLEVPMHDPRAFAGMAVTYALSPRGACHMQGDMYSVDTGQGPALELGIVPGDRLASSAGKGRIAARHQAWRTVYNALILCQFQNPGVEHLLRALNSVTGWDNGAEELLQTGKRILAVKRLLNARRGLTRAGDRLPALLSQPLATGGTEGTVPDLDTMLAGAYAELGWDLESGMPSPGSLAALGLASLP